MNKWRFTEFMEKAGYNQISLARELGMSKNSLNNRLNGRAFFDTEEIRHICELINLKDAAAIVEVFLS